MTTTCLLAWVAIAVTLPVLLILWLTESQPQRICRLRRQGLSQRRIAEQLGISVYAVRKAVAISHSVTTAAVANG
jgi:hypothetical protein